MIDGKARKGKCLKTVIAVIAAAAAVAAAAVATVVALLVKWQMQHTAAARLLAIVNGEKVVQCARHLTQRLQVRLCQSQDYCAGQTQHRH